jgi:basic membrane protein A
MTLATCLLTMLMPNAAGGHGVPRVPLKVGLVADAAALNDRTAGYSIYLGLRRSVRELGVSGRVLTPSPKEGLGPSIAYLARQKYDAVIVAAFEPAVVLRAARLFPQTTFIVPDQTIAGNPDNVRSLIFRVEEVGFLAGYLAGLMERRNPGPDVVSAVGGGRFPAVDSYIAGFGAGARRASRGIRVLVDYADDFVDPRRCRGVASQQIARGAGVVFAVAGNCSFGALDAARVGHVWGVGVDTDLSYLGSHILTSAVKREDSAIVATIRGLQDGSLRRGGSSVFRLRNAGVQLGAISPGVPASVVRAVDLLRRRILSGIVRVPTVN